MLHKTDKGRKKDREEARWAQDAGLDVNVLDREGVEKITPHVPASVQGGVYYQQDALLDPRRLMLNLRRTLQQGGGALRQGVGATGFELKNGAVEAVRTTNGRVRANDIVLAAGAWSAPLGDQLGIDVPVEPGKGYSITYEVPEGRPDVPFILTEDKISVTPLQERMRFAGTLELAGFDQGIDRSRVRPILDTAEEYVGRQVVGGEGNDVWVGFRPCTPDGLPIIGRVPSLDNVALATGHSLMGISLAAITGELVAEILQGEQPSVELESLGLDRFR
jgi:D-amino-acid dehydrogenase